MVAVRASGFLEVLFLVFFPSTTTRAPDPPRSCINTGPTCIESCAGETDGNYQWCGSCQWFIQCSEETTYFQQCPENLHWQDSVKACVAASNSCTECVTDTSPNMMTGITIIPTPPVDALCQSTGPNCISDCDRTINDIYQWCARCDYFLECSGSSTYYMACQAGLYYDDAVKACIYNSTTCHQSPCYVDNDASTTLIMDPCSSVPCLNDGTCLFNTSSIRCICPEGYTGDLCQTYMNATCGYLMHSTPYDPAPGWTNLCEITKTGDEELVNTPCHELLQGLPLYGNSAGLLQAGGNYGCYLTGDYPSTVQLACFDNYQQYHSLSMCYNCEYMVVCLRYP